MRPGFPAAFDLHSEGLEGGGELHGQQQRLLPQPQVELFLAALLVLAGSRHHAVGGLSPIVGPAGGKGGLGEPEPGLADAGRRKSY